MFCWLLQGRENRCWSVYQFVVGAGGIWLEQGGEEYIFGLVELLRFFSVLVDFEIFFGKLRIIMLDCSFLKLVFLEVRVMIECNENYLVFVCERIGGLGIFLR